MKKLIVLALLSVLLIGCNSNEKVEVASSEKSEAINNEKDGQEKLVNSTVKNFLKWYRNYYQQLSGIQLESRIKTSEGEYYVINFDNVDQYIERLRASGYLSDYYLEELRKYFQECNQELLEEKVEEGEIDCLSHDFILMTHEIDESLTLIEKAKVTNTVVHNASATAEIELVYKLKFSLKQQNGSWKIDKIEADY